LPKYATEINRNEQAKSRCHLSSSNETYDTQVKHINLWFGRCDSITQTQGTY